MLSCNLVTCIPFFFSIQLLFLPLEYHEIWFRKISFPSEALNQLNIVLHFTKKHSVPSQVDINKKIFVW